MGRIVAIAGGDLLSTRQLNTYTIKVSNKRNPNVLFIGTASHDAEGYIESITKEYTFLGCDVKSLRLVTSSYGDDEIDAILSWADIIYVGGGDTIFMMQTWKLFKNGYFKIVLDTNLTNTRAQYVYESLGFRKVRTSIDYCINSRPSQLPKVSDNAIDWERYIENRKSSVRCKVGHAFRIIKCQFGYKKTVYRGLEE